MLLGQRYTEDVPVITNEFAERFFPNAPIEVSESPDVFSTPVPKTGLQVWRQNRTAELQQNIDDFFTAAFQVFGCETGKMLQNFIWYQYTELGLSPDGKLINVKTKQPLQACHIEQIYVPSFYENQKLVVLPHEVAKSFTDNARGFAKDFVYSFTSSLQAMPKGTYFKAFKVDKSSYQDMPQSSYGEHDDDMPAFLYHGTDPGGPYCDRESNIAQYRSAGGDLTTHGVALWHGFPTARRKGRPNNRPRVNLNFDIFYPPHVH